MSSSQSPLNTALPIHFIEEARNDSNGSDHDNEHGDAPGPSSAAAAPAAPEDRTPSALDDDMDVDEADEAASPPQTPEKQTARPTTTRTAMKRPQQTANGVANGAGARQAAVAPPPPPRRGDNDDDDDAHDDNAPDSPGTPGHIPPFAWDEFEARYERALADMDGEEAELLREFGGLVEYFNAWASAASAHDDERAVKRLQTRERYVKIAEQTLTQRKQHLTEVVRAFQSALALLSQT